MSKLHELLAVEGDLEGTYRKIIEETRTTFSKKPDHFFGFVRTLEWFTEGMPDHPEEHKAMDTTVSDKLEYQESHIIRYLDAVLQKEATNQKAASDLIVNGRTIAENVPATFLLGLESKLKHILEIGFVRVGMAVAMILYLFFFRTSGYEVFYYFRF